MWKPEHRTAADRSGLRYPSDLSDAEWVLVEPLIPPARHGGRRRSVNVREVLNGIFYILWTGCQWKALPKEYLRRAPCTTILNCGTGTARWSACIMHSTLQCASRKGVKVVPPWRSSTRRPRKALKKGVWAGSFGLRRGQEDQGSQAAHPGRHAGSLVERRCSSCRCSGP
jgi:transposase